MPLLEVLLSQVLQVRSVQLASHPCCRKEGKGTAPGMAELGSGGSTASRRASLMRLALLTSRGLIRLGGTTGNMLGWQACEPVPSELSKHR